MGAFFPQPTKITNTLMIKGAMNPWELHDFVYPHAAIPHPLSCIVSYALSGDVPKGLSVDAAGTISGKIKHFGQQPSCSNNHPKKKPELDGKNWESNGRFKKQTFTFKFKIKVNWLEKQDTSNGPIACVISGSTTASCELTVVKDHNIDNQIFKDTYLADNPFGDEADPKPLQPI